MRHLTLTNFMAKPARIIKFACRPQAEKTDPQRPLAR